MEHRFRMRRPSLGARFTLSIGLVILAASALVFAGVYRLQEEQALAQLDTQAKALLSQMVVLRQWVADYGGVWTTQAGDYWWTERAGYYQKTPAMVTKELSSRSDALGYYRFHITSLKLKNPENAPNDFEREALHGFEVNPVPVGDVEPVGNARMYRYMIPLRTSAACLQCHGEQGYQVGDVRGGLSVLVPMAAMEETLAQNRLALALAAGALVAIVMAILYLLIARLIVRPIHQLRVVTVAVGQGNYDVSCAIRTGDELQVLGEAVNQMVHGLKRSHAELHQKIERRNRELASFSNITLMTSQSAALDDVLRGALDETVAVMHVDGGAIHLWDDDRSALTLAATNGLPSKMARLWERHTPVAELAEQPRLIADVPTDSRAVDRVLQENGYRALASIPLKSKNRVLGVMHLLARAARQFTDEDSALLACIGNQIGMAVENTRYTERVEQMAIIEERSRLAREIHDSLAQALGYLNLKTEMLEGTIARGELDGAAREIADVRRVVRDACYDVRESIDGLRTRLSDGAGLFPATAAYLHEFGQRSGLLTEYSVADGEVRLPPVVETEVLRIIQEALANVRKHAQASRVRVAIETVEGASRIVVADDGRGFDLNALDQAQHFGLRIMRERAESLGGTFHVESAPARGTIVTVQVPVTHAKGAQE